MRMTFPPKVDVHHHVIPPQIAGIGHGMAGMEVPEWTLSIDKSFSNSVGVGTSILSVSTPGVSHISDPEESATLARSMNEYCAALRDQNPRSYGFFATVPSLEYPDLVIRELRYALDTLHADGVTLFTRYGNGDGYLGHANYVPIWEEINARKTIVFVHPANNKNEELFNEHLPMPAFDWPHETGRTAMDLILNRRLQQFPALKIILSHAGGTLPALITRSTMIAEHAFGAFMSAEEMLAQAKMFYFDTALSGSAEVLPLIMGFAAKGHILFGSDFPHATGPLSSSYTQFLERYEMDEEMRSSIYHGAAETLFPRLKGMYEGDLSAAKA